jgi:hypothetical protein
MHPPKPVLSYRLGVVGTRDLSNADPSLANRICLFLEFVKDRVHLIWSEYPAYFDSTQQPRLILICSLAKGTDLLVAELASERGYELHVPLAFDRETYSKTNFEQNDIKEKESFHHLLNKATAILELDGDMSLPDSVGYDAASSVLVNYSDAVLAVWDFGEGKGAGGTASSAAKAKAAGIPVLRMRPDRPRDAVFNDDGVDRPYQELKPVIRRQLLAGIADEESDPESPSGSVKLVRREQRKLQTYYEESERHIDLSCPYKIANAILSLRLPKLARRLPPYSVSADEAWQPTTDESFVDSARAHFKPVDQWADGLAIFYANWMRSTVAATVFLGAVLLAYALALKLWSGIKEWQALPAIEGFCVLLLTALVVIARQREVHARWLQYRMLSEFLRSAALASAIGGLPSPYSRFHAPEEIARTWVSFYFRAVIRSMGLVNANMDGNYLSDFKQLLIDRLKRQIDFHKSRENLYQTLDHNSRMFGAMIFLVSFLGAVLQICHVFIPGPTERLLGCDLPQHLSNVALLLPIFGGALAAFVAQESFGRLSHLSATIVRRLENIVRQVTRTPLKSDTLREATSVAIDEMMIEHEEWFMLYSLRDIELPH